ncbi:hypothetical protein BH11PSE1_BH11PSE1_25290 [soil metagenome]
MTPLPPDAPSNLRPVLNDLLEAVRAWRAPEAPTPIYACVQAKLPPAASWPRTVLLVSDLNILAHSDGVHWIRQDTGATL